MKLVFKKYVQLTQLNSVSELRTPNDGPTYRSSVYRFADKKMMEDYVFIRPVEDENKCREALENDFARPVPALNYL